MLSLSQRSSILDAFLTAREELITQLKSHGSCEHCSVEFGWKHGDRTIMLPLRSTGLIQLPSVGWVLLRQLHAAPAVWVGGEVGGQCFHRVFQLPAPLSREMPLSHDILLVTEFITQRSCDLLSLTKVRRCWSADWGHFLFAEVGFPEPLWVSQVGKCGSTLDSLCTEGHYLSSRRHRGADCLLIQTPASLKEVNDELLSYPISKKACRLLNPAKWGSQNKGRWDGGADTH